MGWLGADEDDGVVVGATTGVTVGLTCDLFLALGVGTDLAFGRRSYPGSDTPNWLMPRTVAYQS